MVGGQTTGIQTHLFPWLPLMNDFKHQHPLQGPTAQTHTLHAAKRLGSWSPFLILAVGKETQSDTASPCSPTNRKAVANTPIIFLALQCCGDRWVGRVSLLAWNTLAESEGGVERDGEGREVEREEKEGGGVEWGQAERGVDVTLCHSMTHEASSPWRCPRG